MITFPWVRQKKWEHNILTRMIPDTPGADSPKGERDVFDLIRNASGTEDYVCLHSLGLARHHRKAYAEADFILIGPEGVFCLEVKGGGVSRKDGVWTIGWPGKSYTSHEGPFRQAQGTIYPLIDEIETRFSAEFKRKVIIGWGVIFPDITFDEENPEWSLEVVCDASKKSDFLDYVRRLAKYTREREEVAGRQYPQKLQKTECKLLVECFRRDFDLVPLVSDLIRATRSELAKLSDRQYHVLTYALDPQNPRVLCPGAAGTGKTIIGLEAARRMAGSGQSVLFLCFNRLLSEHLSREITSFDGQIEVWSLHQFMRNVISRAGHSELLKSAELELGHGKDLYLQKYPDLFEEAAIELMANDELQPFQSLIIDEAQDILFSPVIDVIGLMVSGGLEEGRWLFLYDPDLQAEVYGGFDERVMENLRANQPATLPLQDNFRNPKLVVQEACQLVGIDKPNCMREIESRVEYVTCRDHSETSRKVRALLINLLRENVAPSSISILTGCSLEKSFLAKHMPDVGKKIHFLGDGHLGQLDQETITACTISGFKGLENEVVILTDLPVPTDQWGKSIAYVGMTRAKVRVIAMVSEEFLSHRFEVMDTLPRSINGR